MKVKINDEKAKFHVYWTGNGYSYFPKNPGPLQGPDPIYSYRASFTCEEEAWAFCFAGGEGQNDGFLNASEIGKLYKSIKESIENPWLDRWYFHGAKLIFMFPGEDGTGRTFWREYVDARNKIVVRDLCEGEITKEEHFECPVGYDGLGFLARVAELESFVSSWVKNTRSTQEFLTASARMWARTLEDKPGLPLQKRRKDGDRN